MFRLSFLIFLLITVSMSLLAQSPHGSELKLDCSVCHNLTNWDIDLTKTKFEHESTGFTLVGQHNAVDCKSCHTSLVFTQADTECSTCHKDIHQETVGLDCSKCHTPKSWMVEDINGLHQISRFPLVGNHLTADCVQCHPRFVDLYFEVLDIDCYSCHQQDYVSVQDPNHIQNNFSVDCTQCHTTNNWMEVTFDHGITIFELTGVHINTDCLSCHQEGFDGTPTDCFSCHLDEYNNTTDPNHQAANFPNTCEDCHTTTAWTPANFDHDGQYFPIFSGRHNGTWDDCIDCHTIPNDFSLFSCIDCHEHSNQSELNNQHVGIEGYVYESNACFQCHPTGEKEGAFNHALSNFPLTGAHTTLDCQQCHENGYANTPMECVACHQQIFNESANPNHQVLSLPTDCESCHTTNPDWQPASFPVHNQFYELIGAHSSISENCNDCHNGDYNNTPEQCFGCHQDNYNNAPEHSAQNYPTDCNICHTVNSWQETLFDHANTNFPLTGAHQNVNCAICHESGYTGTTTVCYDCHQTDYEQSVNPDHQALSLPTDCES